jgi:hydroxymethylglutaryl-CoA lyase
MSTLDALNTIIPMSLKAISSGKKVQVSVQSAFGCGYEGKIPEKRVLSIVEKYIDNGLTMISLADTAGHANPEQVERLFSEIFKLSDDVVCACHFHNTYGLGIANAYAAYITGVKYFESSFAGLGGCPFTALASGNVCTEDMLHMFQNMGIRNDIKIEKLIQVSKEASEFLKRELPGMIYKTGTIPV